MAIFYRGGPNDGQTHDYILKPDEAPMLQYDNPDFWYVITDETVDGARVVEFGGHGKYDRSESPNT